MRSLPAVALVLLAAATAGTLAAPAPRCGRHLADLLAVVCRDRGYNNPLHHDSPLPAPRLLAGEKASRTKRGVVDECCKSSCTISTLEQYCKEPASKQPQHSVAGDRKHVEPTNLSRVRHKDSPRKARGHQRKKKGKRGNGKCRCARRQRRRKLEKVRAQRTTRDVPAFQIGTVATPFLGYPVIVPGPAGRSPGERL